MSKVWVSSVLRIPCFIWFKQLTNYWSWLHFFFLISSEEPLSSGHDKHRIRYLLKSHVTTMADTSVPSHPSSLNTYIKSSTLVITEHDLSSLCHTTNFHWLSNFTYGNTYVSMLLSTLRDGREIQKGEDMCIQTYGWFMLIYGRSQHNIVKQLTSN